jgi:uncharacterized protein (UPF0332 family)
MAWQVYLTKARNSLGTAQSAYGQRDFDSCASRAYFAVFQAEIAALIKLTEFRQDQWRHERVQAEFNQRLIQARKVFPASLRSIHDDLIGRRHTADYTDRHVSARLAEQYLRRATEMLTAMVKNIGRTMKTRVTFPADAKTLDVLAKFLERFEKISPEPSHTPKAVLGEDNIIFVEVGYKTDDDAILIGERMAEVAADLLDETNVLVVLAPFVAAEAGQS